MEIIEGHMHPPNKETQDANRQKEREHTENRKAELRPRRFDQPVMSTEM